MYPVRKKGPQQLRREERMRADRLAAEVLLRRLVDGERVGALRLRLRQDLSWLARDPSWCRDDSFRSLTARETASAALRVPNFTDAELKPFAGISGQNGMILAALLEHRNASYLTKFAAIHERCRMTQGRLDDELLARHFTDLPVAAAILLCGALPLEPQWKLLLMVERLLRGGLPAVETFRVLWQDAHRANGMAAQKLEVVEPLLDQTLLVLT